MESFEGAVMVADISGFTRLTEQLSRDSQAAFGIELLTKCMNNYFTKVAIASCNSVQSVQSAVNDCSAT